MSHPRRHIAILGTRGVPASYSGFETCVEETAWRFVDRGYDTTVYCRRHHYAEHPATYRGSRLVFLPSIRSKHLDTISHTLLSVAHLARNRSDVAILYGLGNSILAPLVKCLSIPVISVLDGADWRRKKWGGMARRFLRTSRSVAIRSADRFVIDSEILAESYAREFGREPVYIPYGANPKPRMDESILERFGLEERRYAIFVGRFVREKNVEMLLRAFRDVEADTKLVVVGGNPLDPEYEQSLRALGDERVVFTGMLYGPAYETLVARALLYVSCSRLEGTSPSLLSAMALNGCVLVADHDENRETLKGYGSTFVDGDERDFREKLAQRLGSPELAEAERSRTAECVRQHYDWNRVAEQFIDLVEEVCSRRAAA